MIEKFPIVMRPFSSFKNQLTTYKVEIDRLAYVNWYTPKNVSI